MLMLASPPMDLSRSILLTPSFLAIPTLADPRVVSQARIALLPLRKQHQKAHVKPLSLWCCLRAKMHRIYPRKLEPAVGVVQTFRLLWLTVPMIKPPVLPLLEPRGPQPVGRDPGRHVFFGEPFYVLVEYLPISH